MLIEFRFITFGVTLLLFNRLSTEFCCDPEAIGDDNPAGTAATTTAAAAAAADDDDDEEEDEEEDDEEDDVVTELLADCRNILAIADGRLGVRGGPALGSGRPPLMLEVPVLLSCSFFSFIFS